MVGAPPTSVRVHQDKTVEILPRWGDPTKITLTKRSAAQAVVRLMTMWLRRGRPSGCVSRPGLRSPTMP